MVRIIVDRIIEGNLHYIEGDCLSTDTKPASGLVTGSVMIEVDTSKAFFFDEVRADWLEAGGASNG